MTTIHPGETYEDGALLTEEQRLNSRLGIYPDVGSKLVSA